MYQTHDKVRQTDRKAFRYEKLVGITRVRDIEWGEGEGEENESATIGGKHQAANTRQIYYTCIHIVVHERKSAQAQERARVIQH